MPVRGPQGPALRVAEPPPPGTQRSAREDSLCFHLDVLVLCLWISALRLRFDLSWPAHCLTVTPQHGLLEPQSHLQILISPNPSLASRPALPAWSGQVYVQCDGQQKVIKVQIRQDLALDVSAAPADPPAALPAQAATPLVLPVSRLAPGPPPDPPREAEVRWYLSSFAPPYGVDDSEDVYRATYTAFRCSRASGTLGVPITFLPRDRGDYAQFWDLESHPVGEPQQKSRVRFQLCGTVSDALYAPQEGDCSLVKTEASVKSRRRADAAAPRSRSHRGVYAPQDVYAFPATRVGQSSSLKVNIRNNSADTHEVRRSGPFHIKHSKYSLRPLQCFPPSSHSDRPAVRPSQVQHYLKLPVQFRPGSAGSHSGLLLIQSETSGSLVIQLTAEALP
uniref:Uncharacterized protein n=1 Tax=Salarias fasciatus TaxID=181472 RepID=A0A672H580_SALFA